MVITQAKLKRYYTGITFFILGILLSHLGIAQILFTPAPLGSSPNPVGSGARAMGQGNAFISIADDATSASWNPGGLSQLEKPEFSFAYEYFSRSERINSVDHPESKNRRALNLQDLNYASFVIPYFYNRNMVFSLNYLKLYRFEKEANYLLSISDSTSALNRFIDFDQEGSLSVLAPAFGIDVTPKLALGITFNIWNHSVTQASQFTKKETTNANLNIFGEDAVANITDIDSFEVDNGYSFVLGGLYRISKAWSIGAVLKPYYELNINRRNDQFRVQTTSIPDSDTTNSIVSDVPPTTTTNFSEVELEFPWIIGAGVAWRPNDEWTVSMDVTWTDWSDYTFVDDEEEALLGSKAVKNPFTGQPLGSGKLDDTYTVRLGSEYIFIVDKYLIPIRWGVGYDPTPSVDEVDNFYTINFGIGVQINEKMNLDIAYEYRWGKDVNGPFLQEHQNTDVNGTQDVAQHRILTSLIYYY